jgi:hypothetical protein
MKKTTLVLSLTIVLIALLGGCKKNEDTSFDPNILIKHTWKVTGFTMEPGIDYNGDGTIDADLYTEIYGTDCMQTNFYIYNADFTAKTDHACAETTSGLLFPWSFVENNTKIKFGSQTCDIIQLTETTFVYSSSTNTDGINYKSTMTLTAR